MDRTALFQEVGNLFQNFWLWSRSFERQKVLHTLDHISCIALKVHFHTRWAVFHQMSDCIMAVDGAYRQSPLRHRMGIVHDMFTVGLNGRKAMPVWACHTFPAQGPQKLDTRVVEHTQMVLEMRLLVSFALQVVCAQLSKWVEKSACMGFVLDLVATQAPITQVGHCAVMIVVILLLAPHWVCAQLDRRVGKACHMVLTCPAEALGAVAAWLVSVAIIAEIMMLPTNVVTSHALLTHRWVKVIGVMACIIHADLLMAEKCYVFLVFGILRAEHDLAMWFHALHLMPAQFAVLSRVVVARVATLASGRVPACFQVVLLTTILTKP
mmetsp:Transcript_104880/g.271665  ORF Transcript_104880/g.271665 Transcript_104880/m.271665 type:complete len:324 (+) Transcript_104880:3217-4188(+)